MKKTLFLLLIVFGITAISRATEAPSVKLGEVKNGKNIITYDKDKLHMALSHILENQFLEIDSTVVFFEEGEYYLWALIKDKTTQKATGKLVFSLEKTEKNDLIIAAAPKYILQCLLDSGNCSVCIVQNSICSCYIGDGTCVWKKIPISGGAARVSYGKTFEDLLKGQSSKSTN